MIVWIVMYEFREHAIWYPWGAMGAKNMGSRISHRVANVGSGDAPALQTLAPGFHPALQTL